MQERDIVSQALNHIVETALGIAQRQLNDEVKVQENGEIQTGNILDRAAMISQAEDQKEIGYLTKEENALIEQFKMQKKQFAHLAHVKVEENIAKSETNQVRPTIDFQQSHSDNNSQQFQQPQTFHLSSLEDSKQSINDSLLKSTQINLIISNQPEAQEEYIQQQIRCLLEELADRAIISSSLSLWSQTQEILYQIINNAIISSTTIYPTLPYNPKPKPIYTPSMDQLNKSTNIFFTALNQSDSTQYSKWQCLLIIISEFQIREITVFNKEIAYKTTPKSTERCERYYINYFNLNLFTNNVNICQVKFKKKYFLSEETIKFKVKDHIHLYRGKSIAIYDLINDQAQVPYIKDYALFYSITHLTRSQMVAKQCSISQMFKWLKLLTDLFDPNLTPQHQRILMTSRSLFSSYQESDWFIYFFNGIFKQQTPVVLDKYLTAKNMQFKNIYNVKKWEKSKHYEKMQLLYSEYLLYNKLYTNGNSLQLIDTIFKNNLVFQAPEVAKRIIVKISLWSPRVLARCSELVGQTLLKSSLFTAEEFFLLKSRYLPFCFESGDYAGQMAAYQRVRETQRHSYLIISFIADLIQKTQKNPQNDPKGQIAVSAQGLKNIFIVSYKFSSELRILQAKFCDMYMQVKKLMKVNQRISQAIYNTLLIKMQHHYPTLLEKHSSRLIILMLMNPVLAEQEEALCNFFEEHNFSNAEVNDLIAYYLEYSGEIGESRFLDKVGKILHGRENPKFQFYSIFKRVNEISNGNKPIHKQPIRKIFFTLLSNLLIPITQHIIPKHIKSCFDLNDDDLRLRYAKRICTEIKRQIKYQEHLYTIINRAIHYTYPEKREYFISIYFQNENSVVEEVQEKLWDCLTKNIDFLHSIRTRFKMAFEPAARKSMIKIEQNKLTAQQLNSLFQNIQHMTKYLSRQFITSIQRAFHRKQQFHQKLKLIQYILGKCQPLTEVCSYFLRKESDMRTKNIEEIYIAQIGQDQQWLFQYCHQLRILLSYQHSFIASSNILQELKSHFAKEKTELLEHFQKFSSGKLNYFQLQKYFPPSLVADACRVFAQKDISDRLIRSAMKMHKKNMNRLEVHAKAYVYLVQSLKNQTDITAFQLFLQVADNLKGDANQVLVTPSIQLIQSIQDQIIEVYGIKPHPKDPMSLLTQLQTNQLSHVVRSTYQAKPLFQMIQTRKIDQRFIGDLREYINDQQNSALRIDSVKEFQNVVEYWTLLKQAGNMKEYVGMLEKKLEKSQGDIWLHIDNCQAIYRLIDQKLDEAANRQTSFKYQIQAIFQNSTLVIKKERDSIEIQVLTTPLLTGASFINRELVIDYRRLQTFKDKSILLISDIQRQQNQDLTIHKTLLVFKKFQEYFTIVQNINLVIKQLMNYGYNAEFVLGRVKVSQSDFRELVGKEEELEIMCREWVKGIKDLYKESYILTHFTGAQLSVFIDRCLKHQYHSSLFAILELTEAEFQTKVKEKDFQDIIALAAKSEPLSQIKLIVQAYLTFQQKIRQSNQMQENESTANITLQSVAQKYFYCCLVEGNSIASSNRIFYCLQSTKTQQIQVFLWRAMIDPTRKYYFIGVHCLKEQTKLYFWNQLLCLLEEHKQQFLQARFTFIDNLMTDKFYSFIVKSRLFNVCKNEAFDADLELKTKKMIDLLPSTRIVESAKAGLGKTHMIGQLSALEGKRVRHFPISGNVEFSRLASRLKNLHMSQDESLSISLFQVQDWRKIQVFLSELILFRSFYFEQFIFLPHDLWIFVEIENVFQQKKQEIYPLLNLLTKYGQGIFIKDFQIDLISFDVVSDQEKFVLLYLELIDQPGALVTRELNQIQAEIFQVPANSYDLIEKYFLSWFKGKEMPTFTCYKCFMKMLYKSFKAFSECQYLKIDHVMVAEAQFQFLEFSKFREAFLKICIENVLEFLEETYTSNDFSVNAGMQTFHDRMNKLNLLILPSSRSGHYQFIYTADDQVPLCIKSLLLTQNPSYFRKIAALKSKEEIHQLFSPTALNNLNGIVLQQKLQQILIAISDGVIDQNIPEELKSYYYPNFKDYKLTLDNFIKICLIWHRASSGIPCIIMGESGVGKTKLISFFVEEVLKNVLVVINLHAGIHEEELAAEVERIKKTAEEWGSFNRVWVFFDEFNTCDELGYIKEMVVDHRFLGEPLPENIIIIAACNPYRKKRKGKLIRAGIRRPQERQNQLAFTVKAPPVSMIQLMWDYQQLKGPEMQIYIEKMIENISYKKKGELINLIVYTHEFLKNNIEISSASLRDVARFRKVYQWFDKFMPKSGQKDRKDVNPNYRMDRNERCVILTYSFCYCLRLATSEEREHLYANMEEKLNFPTGWVKKVVLNEQIDYVTRLTISDEQIALNTALVENVFTCLVCLLNKIPILLIGNPGSSKSLSMRLIQSNMRGKGSQSQFCSQFPELNVLYFQGSESSTSKGVELIFQKAIRWKNEANKKWKIQQCIHFDEIGLAEKSVHNPLKVLHSKLQTTSDQVCFIGISNWQLDLAKMSRFLVIARSTPDIRDLQQTAYQISHSYLNMSEDSKFIGDQISARKWESLGRHYYRFIEEWEKNRENKKNFFGLRDFYGYVKFICGQVIKHKGQIGVFEKAMDKSIQINFDGQPNSVQIFKKVAGSISQEQTDPLKLIQFNLQRSESRCLLLIIKGDSLVPLVNKGINLGSTDRKMICIHGSTFSIDQQSQSYNQEMTALTINHISRGNVLAFKDINNSIQTSLYDLFNKSFTRVGKKRYCRIAVGANSNPKCLVHHNFNAIVYIQENRLESLDPPFLNRFEKHYLNIKNMISKQEMALVEETKKWIEDLLSFRSRESILKNQQFLLNSSEEAVITLVIKHRKAENPFKAIQNDLLANQTTDFSIAIENTNREQLQHIGGNILENGEDYIIYTYDQFGDLSENSRLDEGSVIHIEEIDSEKELRKELKKSLQSQHKNMQIYLNYQSHRGHLSFILFLIDQLKTSLQIKKQTFVIIQMHRFSLHHLKIDQVNISYLHPFRQVFIETLSKNKNQQLQLVLRIQEYYQAFQILHMQEGFSAYFTETIKCCKFVNPKEKNERISRVYFQQCSKLRQDQYFVQTCLQSIQKSLRGKKLDLKILQHNNEDIISCSNILEAIEKHIEEKLKEIIYEHLKILVERGLLFHFNSQTSNYLQNVSLTFKRQYVKNKKVFYGLTKEEFKSYLEALVSKEGLAFKKGVEKNIVTICEEVYLLPMALRECDLLLSDSPQSVSSLSKKINIESSSKDEIIQIVRHQKQLMKSNSKVYQVYQASQPELKDSIERYLVFDILTSFLAERNRKKYHIELLTNYFLLFFKECSIDQKAVFVAFNPTLTLCLLDLQETICHNPKIAERLLSEISFEVQEGEPQLGILKLIQTLIESVLRDLSPSQQLIKSFASIKQFSQYFSTIYSSIKAFYASFDHFGEKFIEKAELLHQFLIFLGRLGDDLAIKIILQFEGNQMKGQITMPENLFSIISVYLTNHTGQVDERVLNFLSSHILTIYLKQRKKSTQQDFEDAVNNCLSLVDRYPSIANKSASIFEAIFEFKRFESLTQCLQAIKNKRVGSIQERINFKSSLSVSLGFYFSKVMKYAQTLEFSNFTDDETLSSLTITNYFDTFKTQLQKFIEEGTPLIEKISILQFSKLFTLSYLAQLTGESEHNPILDEIDEILCRPDDIIVHLRLFLAKHLLAKYGQLQKVRRYYIEMKRCKWIFNLKELLQEQRTEVILPLVQSDNEYEELIKTFSKSNFTNLECFHEIIGLGLVISQRTYLLLNYFMTTFYMRNSPQQYIPLLLSQVQNRDDLKQPINALLKKVLIMYLQHRISNKIEYDIKNPDNPLYLILLNYFNVAVSCRKQKSPLLEMFFSQNGQSPHQYHKWIDERILIGSMVSPSVERIDYLLKKEAGDASAAYYLLCTEKNCAYATPIGGFFYKTQEENVGCGTLDPGTTIKCNLCGKISKILEDNSYQGRIVDKATILLERESLEKVDKVLYWKDEKMWQQKLRGYQLGSSLEQLRRSNGIRQHFFRVVTDYMEKESPFVHIKILRSVMYFVWLMLAETSQIKEDQLNQVFSLDFQSLLQFLMEGSKEMLKMANGDLSFSQKEEAMIWHFTLAKRLHEHLSAGEPSLSLLSYSGKQQFQRKFDTLVTHLSGANKERVILDNRRSLIINKSEILKEFGNVQLHQQQYRMIKMFKLLAISNSSKLQSLQKLKYDTLLKQYSLISYIINFKDKQRLRHFYHILLFLSKMTALSLKMNRSDSNTSIIKVVQQYFCNSQAEREESMIQMKECIRSWNELAKGKYRLKDGCNFIGELAKITENMPIRCLIADRNNPQNTEGIMANELIVTIAHQYNQICEMMENLARQGGHNFMSQFKMNPTTFNGQNYLHLPLEALQQSLTIYSYYSVQYGLKELQYEFQKIQSLIINKLNGCRYFLTNKDDFQYIKYIGEDNSFMIFMRQDSQLPFNVQVFQRLEEYFKKQQKNRGETFYKFVKEMIGSLENMIVCFKNKRNYNAVTVGEFINEFKNVLRVKNFTKELSQDPLQSLSIFNLGSLYEMLQSITFQYNRELLNPIYCQPLTQRQLQHLEPALVKMKNEAQGLPSLLTFKFVLQRFLSRVLLLSIVVQKNLISNYICEIYWLWPKNQQMETYTKKLRQILGPLQSSKTNALLQAIDNVIKEAERTVEVQIEIPKAEPIKKEVKQFKKMAQTSKKKKEIRDMD